MRKINKISLTTNIVPFIKGTKKIILSKSNKNTKKPNPKKKS